MVSVAVRINLQATLVDWRYCGLTSIALTFLSCASVRAVRYKFGL